MSYISTRRRNADSTHYLRHYPRRWLYSGQTYIKLLRLHIEERDGCQGVSSLHVEGEHIVYYGDEGLRDGIDHYFQLESICHRPAIPLTEHTGLFFRKLQ